MLPVDRPAVVPEHTADPPPHATRFVGRRTELAELVAALGAGPGPDGPVQLISGSPGIGKTRLATELSTVASSRGVRTVWGHGQDESGAPPYWPWIQVVRELLGRPAGSDLAELVLDEPQGAERFELFDAVAEVVRSALEDAPVLIVLDDLHDVDGPSLLLTRFVARQLRREPLLLVATHRPVEAATQPVLAEHLASLARLGRVTALGGLAVDEVRTMVDDPDSAADVHAVTAGNPLHVVEVVRAGRRVDGAPAPQEVGAPRPSDGLRLAVLARVEGLDPRQRDVLRAAAVLGPRFDLVELEELAGHGNGDALRRLSADQVLVVSPSGHGELTHPLIAEMALWGTPETTGHQLHARAAELSRGDDHRISEHAHHLLHAGPTCRAAAVDACRRAAEAVSRSLAHEDASDLYRRALDAVGDDPAFADRRLDLLVRLGGTLWQASRSEEADEAFEEAWAVARRLGDGESLGRAALRSGLQYFFSDTEPSVWATRIGEALEAQPPGDSELRALLLASLATEHLAPGDMVTARAMAAESLAMARRLDDPVAVGSALVAEQVSALGPSTLQRRIDGAHEILACAREAGDYRLKVHGRFLLMGALLESGDLRALDSELSAQHQLVEDLGEPRFARFVNWFRATRALADGRADEAEAIAQQCLEASTALRDPDALGVYGGQLGITRWVQGRIMEMEPIFLGMRAGAPTDPLWSAALAWIWADQGHHEAARGALAELPPPATVPEGMHWLLTMTAAGEAAATVGTNEQAEAIWEQLLPYRDRVVPVAMGAATWGTVAKPLGRLAVRLGHIDEGIEHLTAAIGICSRSGARPWLVDAQLELARVLVDHRPDDDRIAALVEEASTTAAHLGLTVFDSRSAALAARPGGSPRSTDQAGGPRRPVTAAGRPPAPRVDVLGAFEVLAGDGTPARWTSRKARDLLKVLVARRGAPIGREQLMDLLWPGEEPAALSNRLSVALSTVRRTLDPERACGVNDLVDSNHGDVRLRLDRVDVDAERFLTEASALTARRSRPVDLVAAAATLALHRGEALPAEPHVEWAAPLRSEVRACYVALARLVAEGAAGADDPLTAADAHRRILDVDPYDEQAHLGRVAAFRIVGAHGQADAAYRLYVERMAELDVPPAPDRSRTT